MSNNKDFIGKIVITKSYNESRFQRFIMNSRKKLPLEINCYYNKKFDEYDFIENQWDETFSQQKFLSSIYMKMPNVQNQYNNLLKVINREKLLTKLLKENGK